MNNLLTPTLRWTYLALLFFNFIGCSEWKYRRLESAELITSTQLRQNWNDYNVYYRPNAAILYKIRNDRKIKLPRKWVEVAREDMVTDNTVFYLTDVRKILGQDDGLYGYIVYSYRDSAFIKIIDANTVELIFNHQVQGAP
ncbi:hypothetical protein ACFL2S_07355 [Thermodesulfobacteriota bacterium]